MGRLPQLGDHWQQRYEITEILGTGGFGFVCRATDVELRRDVAIKFLLPEHGGETNPAKRFAREARLLAGLRSQHTIQLFDYGESDGLMFMVFEHVDGRDLQQDLNAKRVFPIDAAVHVAVQVLDALEEAHAAGVIHRDIKPGNIILYEHRGDPFAAKLIDFGIAKVTIGTGPMMTRNALTSAGVAVGTPKFMSPEQACGEPLGPAADVFSVGLVLAEMLGVMPPDASDRAQHFRALLSDAPIQFAANTPQALRVVLDRMVAKDSTQRYATAAAAATALRRAVDAEAVLSTNKTDAVRGTHPPKWMVALAFVAILALGAGALMWDANQKPPPQRHVTKPPTARVQAPVGIAEPTPDPAPSSVDLGADLRTDAAMVNRITLPTQADSAGCGKAVPFLGQGRIHGGSVALFSKNRGLAAYIPRGYRSNVPTPLIIALHQTAETPNFLMNKSGLARLADDEGIIIVAPKGQRLFSWNEKRGVQAVQSALDLAAASLCVDQRRVYAFGHGAGGRGVEGLCRAEVPIAAMATASWRGTSDDALPQCIHQIPYLHIAPTADPYNPVEGGRGCASVQLKRSLVAKELHWRVQNVCTDESVAWKRYPHSECVTWSGCAQPFVSCHVDGGRGWHAAPRELSVAAECEAPAADAPYAEMMWEFLREHSLQTDPLDRAPPHQP